MGRFRNVADESSLFSFQVIDFFHLFDIAVDIFVFFGAVFLRDFPERVAAFYLNTGVIFISRNFGTIFCLYLGGKKRCARYAENQEKQQESGILFLRAFSGFCGGRVVSFVLFHIITSN